MKLSTFLLSFLMVSAVFADTTPDKVYMSSIKTVQLFQQNNQESLPIIHLGSSELLELHFDDLDGYVKNFYYTFQLCNADGSVADVSPFDYIRGYQQQRLTQYRNSSISATNYVHYQLLFPEQSCQPAMSGNYLLKVYINGDTSQLAFTKRFYVLDPRFSVGAAIMQPFDNQLVRTHQKLQFSISTNQENVFNPQQQVQVKVMQNYRWDNMLSNLQPSFIRGNVLEYNGEQDCLMEAGKEYRWADLRSFRFESDRVARVDRTRQVYTVYMKPDFVRSNQRYMSMKDYNGWYNISATESINPWWQSDYANVVFTFIPPNNRPIEGNDVYLMGEITGNALTRDALMHFDEEKGVYEKTLFLKQGYYDYTYVTAPSGNTKAAGDVTLTDGNNWETENDYVIFVYYRSLSDRYDELVAISTVNSRNLTGL